MPKLIRLYITQVFIGFGLSAIFVGLLLWANVANLAHLVSTSDMGWLAVLMLFMFNGLVFAGVQFAIMIMRMEQPRTPPSGGKRIRIGTQPVVARAVAKRRDRHDRWGA